MSGNIFPQRPNGFYETILKQWRLAGAMQGLNDNETIICAAQFVGLAVAAVDGSPAHHQALLDVATRAMHTAYAGRMATKNSFAFPRTAQTLDDNSNGI